MQIILLEKVHKLGQLGDEVSVKPGYGRYLVPAGKAVLATRQNKATFQARRDALEARAAQELAEAEERKTCLLALDVVLRAKSGREGRLFGSVNARDIAEVVSGIGVHLDKHEIRLEQPLRMLGVHEVQVRLHPDVSLILAVHIQSKV